MAAALAVAGIGAVIAAEPASASTLNGVATIVTPGTTTNLVSGGSTAQFGVVLPPQAACDGDTATDGYHVFSYLVPQATNLSTVTFIGHPSVGVGLVNSDDEVYGPVNTAIGTGQVPSLPNNFEWAPLVTGSRLTLSQLLYTGSGPDASGIWEAGIACANSSGALADNWNTEVTFDASSTDTNGFTWSAVPGPSGSAFAAFTSGTSTTFTEGTSGTFAPTASGNPAPTITETGTLPGGVTFSGGALGGTPTASGVFAITFTATNGIGSPATQSFSLVVDAAPAITSPDTVTVATGGPITPFQVTATGYPAPTFSSTGNLDGLTLNPNSGDLTGTPTADGDFSVTLTASNGIGSPANQTFSLDVDDAPNITSPDTVTVTTGGPITPFQVTATGNPAPTFSSTGNLDGLTLDPTSGDLTGTPTAPGAFSITLTVSNGVGSPDSQTFSLVVDAAPAITSPDTVTVATGGPITPFQVTATGYPAPTFSSTGNLDGLTLDPTSGDLTGTPTAPGAFSITLTASNGVGSPATQAFALDVDGAPSITSPDTVTVATGGPITPFQVTASGYPAPTFSSTGNLDGLTLDPNSGDLTGTPTAGGDFSVTITASNGIGSPATQSFTLVVHEAPSISSYHGTAFVEGIAGTFTVKTTGFPAPIVTESGTLPSGVTLDHATGVLSGTPTSLGRFPIVLTAHNGVGTPATQSFTLSVVHIKITTVALPSATLGSPYTETLAEAGGTAPFTWAISSGSLPAGLRLAPSTGTISGTPHTTDATGTDTITVTVTDHVHLTASRTFHLVVHPASSS